MLTLNTILRIPAHVPFSVVGEDAFLLNIKADKYYGLDKVGARLWELLNEGKSLKDSHQIILNEYEVDPAQLEKDLLRLIEDLLDKGLVEVAVG